MKYLSLGLVFAMASPCMADTLQVCLPDAELNPQGRFSHEIINTDAGDYKVVNDAATGLQWSYCFVGQTLSADQQSCDGIPLVPENPTPDDPQNPNQRKLLTEAVEAENHRIDTVNHSWHLPNTKQLLSIYNEACFPAYYPAFSYKIGLTEDEINTLADTERDWTGDKSEQSTIDTFIAYRQGNAYRSLIVMTDSALPRYAEYYYSILFKHIETPLTTAGVGAKKHGMLRLVRKKPL
ncbi:MAG: hypothetical protein GYB23_14765 [Vibrionaceae bacterium]|nr:hypothetical protein [Vibrionaceae bacterium]